MLTKIGRRVLVHKNKITARIIKQNKGIILIFSRGDLVWLLFNTKLYLSTELKKISYRVLERNYKISLWFFFFFRFLLISPAGLCSHDLIRQIKGVYQASNLEIILFPNNFDNLILLDENQIIITHNLPKIISLQNNHRTIVLVQKTTRTTNRKQKTKDILR
jgi:hypothetical protein